MASETFGSMYKLTDNNGVFKLGALVDSNVHIKDTRDGHGDNTKFLGDVPNDGFKVSGAPGHNGNAYQFVSVANIGNVSGFIGEDSTGHYFFFTNDNASGDTGDKLHEDSGLVVQLCFMQGTRVATPSGEVAVELLKAGDLVLTVDRRAVPVRWLGRQTVVTRFAEGARMPVRVRAGAFGESVPSRDLVLSQDHALFVNGILVQAGALVNGTSIVQETQVPATFVYYHVEVDDHSLILAENTPAETFVDNAERTNFDNWHEFAELYPDGKPVTEMPYPRAKAYRQVPGEIRLNLAERGLALYGAPLASVA